MKKENTRYRVPMNPVACGEAMVTGDGYRFTILTERLIRMEYQKENQFTDEATQTVVCRQFDVPEYRVIDEENRLEIVTSELHLYYNKKKFCPQGLRIELKTGYAVYGSVWNYGDELNDLRGTARTLDNADGVVELEHGLMSREGFSVIDDSNTAVLDPDGNIRVRSVKEEDIYFLGYGHDYLGCLKEFYKLCGRTPLLPRYTLGNWWSRFYPYTEQSYLELMEKFACKDIPFSVAVIDMDWHLTDIPKEYGSGWTGYTWNKKYFPNPERFLQTLHKMGRHVTLNVHPADGVRAYEEVYESMAKELGIDYKKKDKIPFDATCKEFMDAYFKYLYHPNEERGVDFWWIDWQQGCRSRIPGIDTLWLLNHLHFIDSGRDGKRPLTFSRYAGIGSHRYPIGFSGDSISSWGSLDFQPYFTANASNAGYTWWSHDIGGHQKGTRDDEMAVRWIQLGVFSPIMRLHSTSNEFYGKEPWNYNVIAEQVMTRFLRLRHALVPYLYTMNYRTFEQGIPLVMPMYYFHDVAEAYEVKNEYYFGSNMIVCPITKPADKRTLLAEFDAWLPEGIFYDLFSNRRYQGNRRIKMYRDLTQIPVMVPAGSILPLAADYQKAHEENPRILDIYVYPGTDGTFELYEDDCTERQDAQSVFTFFNMQQRDEKMILTMEIKGSVDGIIPSERSYRIHFVGVDNVEEPMVKGEGIFLHGKSYDDKKRELEIQIKGKEIRQFEVEMPLKIHNATLEEKREEIRDILRRAQMEYDLKEKIDQRICNEKDIARILSSLNEMALEDSIYGSIVEVLCGDL